MAGYFSHWPVSYILLLFINYYDFNFYKQFPHLFVALLITLTRNGKFVVDAILLGFILFVFNFDLLFYLVDFTPGVLVFQLCLFSFHCIVYTL